MSKFWTTHSSKEKKLHYLNNRENWIINIKEIEHKNVDGIKTTIHQTLRGTNDMQLYLL
jgi:hypothetical protein